MYISFVTSQPLVDILSISLTGVAGTGRVKHGGGGGVTRLWVMCVLMLGASVVGALLLTKDKIL